MLGNSQARDSGLKGVSSADFIVKTTVQEGSFGGVAQHTKSKQVCSFKDALELTLRVQEKLAEVGFPQPAAERRRWTSLHTVNKADSSPRREDMEENKHRKAAGKGGPTFFIRINFQQNASWQGSVQWLEGQSTRFFRSHLELMMLMQEAVDKSGGAEKMVFNSWEDAEEIIS